MSTLVLPLLAFGLSLCALLLTCPELLASFNTETLFAPYNAETLFESDSAFEKSMEATSGVVGVDCGNVVGRWLKTDVWAFTGIPYAAPPVGDLRWQPPIGLKAAGKCWKGQFEATQRGNACVQKVRGLGVIGHEDCLVLDLYTPHLETTASDPRHLFDLHAKQPVTTLNADGASSAHAREHWPLRPVVIYLHGGAADEGSVGMRDGQLAGLDRIANSTQAVVVAINHRLNAFGFMALDALSKRDRRGVSGNYGLLDVIEALRWVQANVRAFGGDPNRVTLVGSASGATAMFCLMSAPHATRGLFHAAFAMSPSVRIDRTLVQASAENEVFVRRANCSAAADVGACLAALAPHKVIDAIPWDVFPFWSHAQDCEMPAKADHMAALLILDGQLLTAPVHELIGTDRAINVPLVVGSMAQEAAAHVHMGHELDLRRYLASPDRPWNASTARALAQLYGTIAAKPLKFQYETIVTDARIFCAELYVVRRAARAPNSHVYLYVGTDQPSLERPRSKPSSAQHTCHERDMPILLDAFLSARKANASPSNDALNARDGISVGGVLRAALHSLVHDLVVPQWAEIGGAGSLARAAADEVYWVNEIGRSGVRPIRDLRKDICDFWAAHGGFDFWRAGE